MRLEALGSAVRSKAGRNVAAALASVACPVALAACSSSETNPFRDFFRMVEPSAACQIVFSSNVYAASPGAPPDIYCVGLGATPPERLTFCGAELASCALIEIAPAPDRQRAAARRIINDSDGDGRLSASDAAVLTYLDLAHGVHSDLVSAERFVSGIDWSPAGEVLLFAARGEGGREDLFRRDVGAGAEDVNLTSSADVTERRPRFSPTGDSAFFARETEDGKSTIWVFSSANRQRQLSFGGAGETLLPGTSYVVGADTDPAPSPDGAGVVFRRLTAVGANARGLWDLFVIPSDGSGEPQPLVTGPMERGAADWGSGGIVFAESDPATGGTALVVVDAGGGGRRVLAAAPPGYTLASPRWLAAAP